VTGWVRSPSIKLSQYQSVRLAILSNGRVYAVLVARPGVHTLTGVTTLGHTRDRNGGRRDWFLRRAG